MFGICPLMDRRCCGASCAWWSIEASRCKVLLIMDALLKSKEVRYDRVSEGSLEQDTVKEVSGSGGRVAGDVAQP